MILRALPGPVLVFATVALVVWQAFAEFRDAWVCAIPLVLWVFALVRDAVTRESQLRALLRVPHAPMDAVAGPQFGIYSEHEETSPELLADRGALEQLLRAHRLVVLVGPRLSGRSRLALAALRHGFGGYDLLRPLASRTGSAPPLTDLLTTSVLRLRGGYALWLEDLGALMQDGFDPRAVERWLSAGRHRVALARMTPVEFHRFRNAESAEAASLDRAIPFRVQASERPHSGTSPEGRYQRLVGEGSPAEAAIRHVATLELLGVRERSLEALNKLLVFLGHAPLGLAVLERLAGEPDPLLTLDADERISAHPAVADLVDGELLAVEAPLLGALHETLRPRGLMAVSQALALRGQHSEAGATLDLARERASGDAALSLAITGTSIRLVELQFGASGVTLANKGGFDHRELVGWEQLRGMQGEWPEDDVFDLRPPVEDLRFASRLYRLIVYRATARVAILVSLDCVAFFVAAVAALSVRFVVAGGPSPFGVELAKLLLPTVPVGLVIAVWVGLYRPDQARAQTQLILATAAITSLTVPLVYFARRLEAGSFLAVGTFFAVVFLLDGPLRFAYDVISRRWVGGRELLPRVLVMGERGEARACARSMLAHGRPVKVVAYLSSARNASDVFCVGSYGELERWLVRLGITELVIADRLMDLERKAEHIASAQRFGIDVRYLANEREVILGAAGRVGDHGLVLVPAALMSPESRELKRLVDWVVVTLTIPLWGLLLAGYGVYSLVWRRGQPVFAMTERIGLGNTPFVMLRLRTRTRVEDPVFQGERPTGRVEALFERLGLDEIPQVINVLRAEMSIVGPRPLHEQDVKRLSAEQHRTLVVRPGMTGRWQVEWGEDASTPEVRALDVDYTRRWRVSHDFDLMMRTPVVVVRRRLYLGDTEVRKRIRAASQVDRHVSPAVVPLPGFEPAE